MGTRVRCSGLMVNEIRAKVFWVDSGGTISLRALSLQLRFVSGSIALKIPTWCRKVYTGKHLCKS